MEARDTEQSVKFDTWTMVEWPLDDVHWIILLALRSVTLVHTIFFCGSQDTDFSQQGLFLRPHNWKKHPEVSVSTSRNVPGIHNGKNLRLKHHYIGRKLPEKRLSNCACRIVLSYTREFPAFITLWSSFCRQNKGRFPQMVFWTLQSIFGSISTAFPKFCVLTVLTLHGQWGQPDEKGLSLPTAPMDEWNSGGTQLCPIWLSSTILNVRGTKFEWEKLKSVERGTFWTMVSFLGSGWRCV